MSYRQVWVEKLLISQYDFGDLRRPGPQRSLGVRGGCDLSSDKKSETVT
jgi:hypothetical protein